MCISIYTYIRFVTRFPAFTFSPLHFISPHSLSIAPQQLTLTSVPATEVN